MPKVPARPANRPITAKPLIALRYIRIHTVSYAMAGFFCSQAGAAFGPMSTGAESLNELSSVPEWHRAGHDTGLRGHSVGRRPVNPTEIGRTKYSGQPPLARSAEGCARPVLCCVP